VTDDDLEHEHAPDGPGIRDLLSLGGMLVGCIVVGLIIGLFVDTRLGSAPVGALLGTALGILAAGIGFWLRVRVYLQGR
jgi:F0F1-type ATP synthase assembly protein I